MKDKKLKVGRKCFVMVPTYAIHENPHDGYFIDFVDDGVETTWLPAKIVDVIQTKQYENPYVALSTIPTKEYRFSINVMVSAPEVDEYIQF